MKESSTNSNQQIHENQENQQIETNKMNKTNQTNNDLFEKKTDGDKISIYEGINDHDPKIGYKTQGTEIFDAI